MDQPSSAGHSGTPPGPSPTPPAPDTPGDAPTPSGGRGGSSTEADSQETVGGGPSAASSPGAASPDTPSPDTPSPDASPPQAPGAMASSGMPRGDPASLRERGVRVAVGVVGGTVVVVGIILLPLPGPGTAVILAGLALLATRFAWARRLLETAERWARRRTGDRWPAWTTRRDTDPD